jgi:hypothetical protein
MVASTNSGAGFHVKDGDADLMTAAPELFEALEALTEAAIEATSEDGDVSAIDGSHIDKARAALAKARGWDQLKRMYEEGK